MTADVIAGRFVLCDPIGAGGSGTVWRAYDEKRHGYCAAKLLRQRDAGDLLRFVREQSVRLDHPHIVSPYSWVAEDGTVLIASELMTGGSLHTLIGDFGPLAESTVVTVLGQVLSGLQAVHDAQLIHRDVKPANLLLRATGDGPLHVVLADFGLTISRLDARLTQVGMVIGTPGYVPPEVLKGGVPPDPRHDLYAVGRLALTMIAGGEPDGPGTQLIGSIQDRSLRATVEALLRRDPNERPVDAMAAAGLLSDGLTDQAPRTRDGDRIEVLDQLPDLPPGWGPDGPLDQAIPGPARVAPRATIVDVVPTAPAQIAAHAPTTDERPSDRPAPTVAGSVPPPPTVEHRPPVAAPTGPPRGDALAEGAPPPVAPPPVAPRDGAARDGAARDGAASLVAPLGFAPPGGEPAPRRRGPILAAAVVAALLVGGLLLALWLWPETSTDDPSKTPPLSPGSSVSNVISTAPQTENSSATPSVTPSSTPTATATPENLRAGEDCTWQQEGDRRTGVDGVALVCTLADGTYQWRSPV